MSVNHNYVHDIINIWTRTDITEKVLNMNLYKLIRTNRLILNNVIQNQYSVKKSGQCYDYNRINNGNNALWTSDEPKSNDMKNQDVYLYFNKNYDTYFCFTKREIMYLKEAENYEKNMNNTSILDLDLLLVEYDIDGSPQNPYNTSNCRKSIDKTHNECDKIWECRLEHKTILESYFKQDIPRYVPIFENNDFFEESYSLDFDDIFSILFIIQTNSKEDIEKCLNNRAGVRYSCLYKVDTGLPDKNHHKNIQVLRFIQNLNLYSILNSQYFKDVEIYTSLRILRDNIEDSSNLDTEMRVKLINIFAMLNERLSDTNVRNMLIPGKTRRMKIKKFNRDIQNFIITEFQVACTVPGKDNDIKTIIVENQRLKDELSEKNIELRNMQSLKPIKDDKELAKLKERFKNKSVDLEKYKSDLEKSKEMLKNCENRVNTLKQSKKY